MFKSRIPLILKERTMNRIAIGIALVLLTAGPAGSQWLKIPLPGTPRTPDGKPDLAAPAPKMQDGKPDLSGIWRRNTPGVNYLVNLEAGGAELSMQPNKPFTIDVAFLLVPDTEFIEDLCDNERDQSHMVGK
jgi:hypothetical protein